MRCVLRPLALILFVGCVSDPARVDETVGVSVREAEVGDTSSAGWLWERESYRIEVEYRYEDWPSERVRRIIAESADAWQRILADTYLGPSECEPYMNGLVVQIALVQDVLLLPTGLGVAEVVCPPIRPGRGLGWNELPRHARIGLQPEIDSKIDEWSTEFVEAVVVHEFGHALGLGPITDPAMYPPPDSLIAGERRYRYECEYAVPSGEIRRIVPWGFNERDFPAAVADYERLDGLTAGFVPGGREGHTHPSLGGIMGTSPQFSSNVRMKREPQPTSISAALLAGIGYDVDMSDVLDTRIIPNPFGDTGWQAAWRIARNAERENSYCGHFAWNDPDFDPYVGGIIRVVPHPDPAIESINVVAQLVRHW